MKKELERLEERLKEVSASILGRQLEHFDASVCVWLCMLEMVGLYRHVGWILISPDHSVLFETFRSSRQKPTKDPTN